MEKWLRSWKGPITNEHAIFIWPNNVALIEPKVNLSIPLILSCPDKLDYRYCTTKLNKQLRSLKWAILWANYFEPGGSKIKYVHSTDLIMSNLARLLVLQKEIRWMLKKSKWPIFWPIFLGKIGQCGPQTIGNLDINERSYCESLVIIGLLVLHISQSLALWAKWHIHANCWANLWSFK